MAQYTTLKGKRLGREFWRARIDEFERSGLSQQAFVGSDYSPSPAPSKNAATKKNGPDGGAIKLANGVSLSVPAGALSEDVEIGIAVVEDASGLAPLPDGFELSRVCSRNRTTWRSAAPSPPADLSVIQSVVPSPGVVLLACWGCDRLALAGTN